MLFLVCFTRLVMRCFLCRPCLTVCRSPLCCMNTPIRVWLHHLGVLVGGWVSCSVWNWDSCSGLAGSFEDVGWCVRGW